MSWLRQHPADDLRAYRQSLGDTDVTFILGERWDWDGVDGFVPHGLRCGLRTGVLFRWAAGALCGPGARPAPADERGNLRKFGGFLGIRRRSGLQRLHDRRGRRDGEGNLIQDAI